MEKNKIRKETETIHSSVQKAVDCAIDALLRGEEIWVNLSNIRQETVKFIPRRRQETVKFIPRRMPAAVVQQRIGDSLRDRYLDLLRLAYAQGFITQQEWDQRAAAALAATTRAELEPLTRDLDEVKREEPKIVPHRHKTCVGLPVVVMLICVAIFVTAAIGLIL